MHLIESDRSPYGLGPNGEQDTPFRASCTSHMATARCGAWGLMRAHEPAVMQRTAHYRETGADNAVHFPSRPRHQPPQRERTTAHSDTGTHRTAVAVTLTRQSCYE